VKVVILCGGLGTRLREETEYRPKPMVEIGGRPILWHIMKTYAHYGYREFVLCLGYKGGLIKDYFLNYEAMNSDVTLRLGRGSSIVYHQDHEEQDFEVTLAETGAESMTGGRLKRVTRYLGDGPFMVTYGDGLADIDVGALSRFHQSHGRLATVTMARVHTRFGILDVDQTDRVREFHEKPEADGWASTGFFVFDPRVLDYIFGDACVLEREPLERLAAEGQLMAYRHPSFFCAMDTYREYLYLNDLWANGRARWRVWE
jgi:glucose-1-phosphate cytidylyltransferase